MSNTNKKSIVYIDGENFVHRSMELLGKKNRQGRNELIGLDLVKFIKNIIGEEENLEIRYYTTRVKFSGVPEKFHARLNEIVQFNSKWLSRIGSQGALIIRAGILRSRETDPCPKCGKVIKYFIEKGVDVRIAVDMTEDSRDSEVKSLYLLSSDLDLLPAIGAAKKNRKKVTYIASAKEVNRAIVASVSETLTFTKNDVLGAKNV